MSNNVKTKEQAKEELSGFMGFLSNGGVPLQAHLDSANECLSVLYKNQEEDKDDKSKYLFNENSENLLKGMQKRIVNLEELLTVSKDVEDEINNKGFVTGLTRSKFTEAISKGGKSGG